MSHLLEVLGRGLLAQLVGAFDALLGTNRDETIEALERHVQRRPDDAEAWIRLGGRYLREDEPVRARAIFEKLLAEDSEDLAAQIGMACSYDALGKLDETLEHLRAAQKLDPVNPAILFCLGFCRERTGELDGAARYYEESIGLCPTLRNAHERLAAIHLKQGDVADAVTCYAALCELDPQHTELSLTLAHLYLEQGDYGRAIARYQHALSLEPENWTAHSDIVSAYEEAGLIREAIEHMHRMIEQQPEFADSRLRLGDLYARIGNDAAATDQYLKAADLNPEYLEANVKLGTQHLRQGRFEDAARWFALALEINDRLVSAYVGIGVAQQAQGLIEEAKASFTMAQNIEPNSTLLFSEVARMQLKAAAAVQADLHLAVTPSDANAPHAPATADLLSQQIDRLQEAVRENPNHADLHYRLGLLLRNRGQIEDAIDSFGRAVAINPTYMKAMIKLGLAQSEAGRVDEAITTLGQAMKHRPDYIDLHYQLGLLFVQRHQFEMAIEHFEKAVAANPTNVAFQANLALALQNMGLIDRAQATWQIVTDLAPDSAYAHQAAEALASKSAESI